MVRKIRYKIKVGHINSLQKINYLSDSQLLVQSNYKVYNILKYNIANC